MFLLRKSSGRLVIPELIIRSSPKVPKFHSCDILIGTIQNYFKATAKHGVTTIHPNVHFGYVVSMKEMVWLQF